MQLLGNEKAHRDFSGWAYPSVFAMRQRHYGDACSCAGNSPALFVGCILMSKPQQSTTQLRDCFIRLFGHLVERTPHYGGGEGRELTAEERQMLAENTEQLIAQLEAEHQALLEQARLRQEQQAKVEQAARERAERLRAEEERRRPPTAGEIAKVEHEAKVMVRQKYGVDPDLPGWRGLVLVEARKLLGR